MAAGAKWLAGAVLCAAVAAHAGEPSALSISPAGHNYRADGMPLQTAESVRASLFLSAAMGIKRVYWRGYQEQYLTRHALRRPENFALFDYWEWLRELDEVRDIHRAALESGREADIAIWGVFGLFDHGSDPREDAYCGAASGHGPAVYTDSLRLKYPQDVPRDAAGIRAQCGTLRLTDPAIRKELIGRLSALMDEGYQGLLLYTYMENLSLWFPGEFDRGNLGPLTADEVTGFVRELHAELSRKNRKLALQVDPRAAFRDGPSPWLGLTPAVNTIGRVPVLWEQWLRDGLLDELVFSVPSGAEAEAVSFAEETARKFPNVPVSLLARNEWPVSTLPLAVDARSPEWKARFLQRAAADPALRLWAECSAGAARDLPAMASADSAALVAALASAGKAPSAANARASAEIARRRGEYPVRQQAAETLAACGDAAAPFLAEMAADRDPAVRRVAFLAANKLEPLEKARPLLLQAAADSDPYNRWIGFRGLARAPLDPALQQLCARTLLADPDPTVRSVAAWIVRPGTQIRRELQDALRTRFVALHDDAAWTWEYRTVGDALMGADPDGRAFLEECLRQTKNLRLADSAWRCLFVRQNGGALVLVDPSAAARAYAVYPDVLWQAAPSGK